MLWSNIGQEIGQELAKALTDVVSKVEEAGPPPIPLVCTTLLSETGQKHPATLRDRETAPEGKDRNEQEHSETLSTQVV